MGKINNLEVGLVSSIPMGRAWGLLSFAAPSPEPASFFQLPVFPRKRSSQHVDGGHPPDPGAAMGCAFYFAEAPAMRP